MYRRVNISGSAPSLHEIASYVRKPWCLTTSPKGTEQLLRQFVGIMYWCNQLKLDRRLVVREGICISFGFIHTDSLCLTLVCLLGMVSFRFIEIHNICIHRLKHRIGLDELSGLFGLVGTDAPAGLADRVENYFSVAPDFFF